jgi:hypothetical protein
MLFPKRRFFLEKLSGTWNLTRVTLDNQQVTEAFGGLNITFKTDMTYQVQQAAPPIWSAGGVFELLRAGNTFSLLRNDDVTITVQELTEQNLVMSFNYTPASGRTSSTSGEFIFEMNR